MTKRLLIFISVCLLFFYNVSFPTFLHLSNKDVMYYKVLQQRYPWLDMPLYCLIVERAMICKLDPIFVCSLIQYESGGKITALSKSKARGLLQVKACHLKGTKLTVRDLYKPFTNLRLGCNYFIFCRQRARRDMVEALRMYNQGHFADRDEYKNWKYVENILNAYNFVKNGVKSTIVLINGRAYLIAIAEIL